MSNSFPDQKYLRGLKTFLSTHKGIPRSINVMGTMGCGKSSIAQALAAHFQFCYTDADLFHSPHAQSKMAGGIPLTTEERLPFLSAVREFLSRGKTITTCSALRSCYRAFIAGAPMQVLSDDYTANPWDLVPENSGVLFIHLIKPRAIALAELDYATQHRTRFLPDGRPHYISVNKHNTTILDDQYQQLDKEALPSWLGIQINTEDFRDISKDSENSIALPSRYDVKAMLQHILNGLYEQK